MNTIENLDRFRLDGIDFTGIGRGMLRCTNQLNYAVSPGRTMDGSMTNINSWESFILPQVEIGFNVIKIETFWKLRQLLLSKRVFSAEYYDVDFNKFVTHLMYVQPDELKDFLNKGEDVIGLKGYKITLTATLTETDLYSATFYANSVAIGTETERWGRSISAPALPTGYSKWKATKTFDFADGTTNTITISYDSGDRINLFENMVFYAE